MKDRQKENKKYYEKNKGKTQIQKTRLKAELIALAKKNKKEVKKWKLKN